MNNSNLIILTFVVTALWDVDLDSWLLNKVVCIKI